MSNSGGIVLAGAGRGWHRATHAPGHMGERSRAGIYAAHAPPPRLTPQTFAHAADRPLLCCTTPAAITPTRARSHADTHMRPHCRPGYHRTALRLCGFVVLATLAHNICIARVGSGRVKHWAFTLTRALLHLRGFAWVFRLVIYAATIAPANTAHAALLHIGYRGRHLSAARCRLTIAAPHSASAVCPTCCTQVGGTYRTIVLATAASGRDCTQCKMRIEISSWICPRTEGESYVS